MGKSNKFDFTNRPSAGVKLGNSIASLLTKDADKLQRDADRAAEKARKQSTGSTSAGLSSTDGRDALAHHVDLQAPNKELGDDGVCALADGLEAALMKGSSTAALVLEDLNLSGNGITTASLARLAPIIRVARHDLKSFNVSNNLVSVVTDEESMQWEEFLRSLAGCFRLNRIDLSSNGLGSRAMEVLARVYLTETSISSLQSSKDADRVSPSKNGVSEKRDSHVGHLDDIRDLDVSVACGLRHIQHINLQDIGLSDAGALWLSYMLEDDGYGMVPSEDPIGVDCGQNSASLGKDGLTLLQKTERKRQQSFSALNFESNDDVHAHQSNAAPPGTRGRKVSRALPNDTEEPESTRKRLQRHLIESEGSRSTELWRAALQLVRLSRAILYVSPQSRRLYTGGALFCVSTDNTSDAKASSDGTPTRRSHGKQKLSVDTTKARPESYAASLTARGHAVGEPEVVITEVTNTPTTPKLVVKSHRKGGFSEGLDAPAVTEKLGSLVIRDDSPERFIRYQQRRMARQTYRDTSIASNLPRYLVERIVSFAMPEKTMHVMSEKQRHDAIGWGQSRQALRTAGEWRKKDESSQVWMLLDAIKCLAYGQ